MLAWAGIGFAIKGQTAFLAPFLFAVLLQRRVPLALWLIPPAVFALLMVPAWLAGWPALDLALIYIHQGAQGSAFVSNAPNPWTLLDVFAVDLGRSMVPAGFALGAIFSLALAWWLRTRLTSLPVLLNAALLSAIFVPTVLPKMHERYFLLADLLSFVVALTLRDRRSIVVAVLVSLGSAIAIAGYVAQAPLLSVVSALPTGLALLLVWTALRNARTAPLLKE
jgi:Gpi18-like mannosyltransferase